MAERRQVDSPSLLRFWEDFPWQLWTQENAVRNASLLGLGALAGVLGYSALDLFRWNEARYLKNWRNFSFLVKSTCSVTSCLSENEGKLVHITGEIIPNDIVRDDLFEFMLPNHSSKPNLTDILIDKSKRMLQNKGRNSGLSMSQQPSGLHHQRQPEEATVSSSSRLTGSTRESSEDALMESGHSLLMQSTSDLTKLRNRVLKRASLQVMKKSKPGRLLTEQEKQAPLIYLMREVEMLQWNESLVSGTAQSIGVRSDQKHIDSQRTEFRYSKVWSAKVIDWRTFQQQSDDDDGNEQHGSPVHSALQSSDDISNMMMRRDSGLRRIPNVNELGQNPLTMPRTRIWHTSDFCIRDFHFNLDMERTTAANHYTNHDELLSPPMTIPMMKVMNTSSSEDNNSRMVQSRSVGNRRLSTDRLSLSMSGRRARMRDVREIDGMHPLFTHQWDCECSISQKIRKRRNERGKHLDLVFDDPSEQELMAEVPLARDEIVLDDVVHAPGSLSRKLTTSELNDEVWDMAENVRDSTDTDEDGGDLVSSLDDSWIDSLSRPDMDVKLLLKYATLYIPEDHRVVWKQHPDSMEGVLLSEGWFYFSKSDSDKEKRRLRNHRFKVGDIRVRFWLVTRPFKMTVIGEQRGSTIDRYTFSEHLPSDAGGLPSPSLLVSQSALVLPKRLVSLKLRMPGKVSPFFAYRRVYKPHFLTPTLLLSIAHLFGASVCAVWMKHLYKEEQHPWLPPIKSTAVQSTLLWTALSGPLCGIGFALPYARLWYERFPWLTHAALLGSSLGFSLFVMRDRL